MKLASLFTRHDTKLPPLGKELDAIEAGKKPFSFFASHRESLQDGSDLMPVMRAAFDRGLGIALLPQPDYPTFADIYVFRVGESWRADEFHRFLYVDAPSPWTPEAEDKQSRLLGYSVRQRAAWRARDRASYVRYSTKTIYAIVEKGTRAIGTGDRVFFDNAESGVYASARSKLPKGTQLVRVGIPVWPPKMRFATATTRITEEVLTRKRAEQLDAAIVAGPEVLGPRGWSALR